MSFLSWLLDRSATCDRLKEACSMYERHGNCLLDELLAERRVMGDINAQGMMREAVLDAELRELASERDGVMRELWMERRRNDELRQRIALTDANVKCCFERMALQQQETLAWCHRLIKDMGKEKARRSAAEADRDRARRQCQESAEELANARFEIGQWKQEAALRGQRIAELETLTKKGPAS